ncbi:MAG: dethiobiotin synthase [Verrucomicrobiota bacterium]|jgi:dethiobiotin synthetase
MTQLTFFITGTDTGVGKTVLTALLVQSLRKRGVNAAALKPICSGNRNDARKIFAAMNGILSLDEINPWHFRAPIAPLLAARCENKKVKLSQVLAHIRSMQKRFDVLLIEGAGGLLSPLGENFNSRDLIAALRATPIVVGQNRLGAVNQILLIIISLPRNAATKARVVLMSPEKPDISANSNATLIAEFFDAKRIFLLPRLGKNAGTVRALKNRRVKQTLRALVKF